MAFPVGAVLVALCMMTLQVYGHSGMRIPQDFSPITCRRGDGGTCDGPCDLRAIENGQANYYPPGFAGQENPRTAATYQRGQQVSVASSRNNHTPGGFMRLAIVPLEKMMSREDHSKYAFHYSCWGAGVTVATEAEITKDAKGHSVSQDDGLTHDLPKAYYSSRVTIPTHIPDGKYVFGWVWYGGPGSSPENVRNTDTAEPEGTGFFGVYWSCAWVDIEGGPMTESYTPVFVNDLSQYSSEGCRASVNTVDGCVVEPCGTDIATRYMKPAEFENGPPPMLTSSMYGAPGATEPEPVPTMAAPTTPAPSPAESNCGGPCDLADYICGSGLTCAGQVCTCADGDVCESEVCVSAATAAPVTQAPEAPVTPAPVDPSRISKCGGACDTLGYVCDNGLSCSGQVCSCGVGFTCENQMCAYVAVEVPVTQAPTEPTEPAAMLSTCGGPCDIAGYICASGLTCAGQVCTCASGDACEGDVCVSAATAAPVTQAPVDPSQISRCGGACDSYGYVCGDGLTCSDQVCECGEGDVCEEQTCLSVASDLDSDGFKVGAVPGAPPAPEAPAPVAPAPAATPMPTPMPTPAPEATTTPEAERDDGVFLQVYAARVAYSRRVAGPVLRDGMQVCPRDYASGMTVVCGGVGEASTERVTFYANGEKVRVERRFPYAIASDHNGRFWRWRARGVQTVRCETSGGRSASATIRVGCDGGDGGDY